METFLGLDIDLLTLFLCFSICFALYLNLMPFGLMGGKIYDIEEKVECMHDIMHRWDEMVKGVHVMNEVMESFGKLVAEGFDIPVNDEDDSQTLFEDRWK